MGVLFLTRDFPVKNPPIPGGCAWYRCYLPMHAIGGVLGEPLWTPEWGFGVKQGTEGLFGNKTVMLKLIMDRSTPHQMREAQKLGQKIIVDVDDFYEGIPESNRAFHITHPDKNKNTNRNFYKEVIDQADLVTVSTPFLLEHHAKTHPNVAMVRNGVYPDMFEVRKHTTSKPVIGWVGAVPYRGNDLEIMRDFLPEFLEKHDLMFHHSGSMSDAPSIADVVGIPVHRLTSSPVVTMTDYGQQFNFDIGLVPLNNIPFNEAKSTIKGLEYASANIPFVASGLPEYRHLAGMGVGRIADTPEEWVKHLEELLDYNVRKREAAVNRQKVIEKHSIADRAQDWRDALNLLNNKEK